MRAVGVAGLTVLLVCCGGRGGSTSDGNGDLDVGDEDGGDVSDGVEDDPGPDDLSSEGCENDEDCDDGFDCTLDLCDLDTGLCSNETRDDDGDGYLVMFVGEEACGGDDCDDSRSDIYPDAPVLCDDVDRDCSGHPDDDEDEDGFRSMDLCAGTGVDCDDRNPDANPDGYSACQDFDADCDGFAENDRDGDGWVSLECGGDDCDDASDDVHPGATEICDDVDQDCDGDLLDAAGTDDDMDGWLDFACGGLDCNDALYNVNPGAPELLCDFVDNDCDGNQIDGPLDDDGDGYIDGVDCPELGGDDCDDDDPSIHPGAAEGCDTVDNDCDGSYTDTDADSDGDGYLPASCESDPDRIDCDDTRDDVHPGADESTCALVDFNCNGILDHVDGDEDGYTSTACGGRDCDDSAADVYPGAPETGCDFVDNDCDGRINEYIDDDNDGFNDTRCGGPDCCDTDSRAFPGQSAWFSNARNGCGGFDYDCDGSEYLRDRFYGGTCYGCPWPVCCYALGWVGDPLDIPMCGESGTWVTGCNGWCSPISETRYQYCR